MNIFSKKLVDHACALLEACRTQQLKLCTAESCSGGLVAALLTEIPGASDVFTHGFVTYANDAKSDLGVDVALIEKYGAVSEQVAIALAEAALKKSGAHLSVAVTGIAGPRGGSDLKPVGLVHIASAMSGKKTLHKEYRFSGNRSAIRLHSVEAAMSLMLEELRR